MTQNQETIKEPRVNVSLTKEAADDMELLRSKLEIRLKERFSMAKLVKRLVKNALEEENQQQYDSQF